MVKKVRKRDGSFVEFDEKKIVDAVNRAAEACEEEKIGAKIKGIIIEKLEKIPTIPTVEQIQDNIEDTLLEEKHIKIAKTFMLYRQKRDNIREEKKKVIGQLDDSGLSTSSLLIATKRYLRRKGDLIETPKEMFRRVAKAGAKYEEKEQKEIEEKFREMLENMEFVPGGRILAGAGIVKSQLQNCFVIPVEDSLEKILQSVHDVVTIQKYGGGTGFSMSKLRPKGSPATQSDSKAVGPVKFLHFFNQASNLISRVGGRKASNMGSLSIEHANIIEFITAKDKEKSLSNFNISVEITDSFMEALSTNKMFELRDPSTGSIRQKIQAKKLFQLLSLMAWKNGDPGVLFIDEINRKNVLTEMGNIETTDPCGENPMLAFESCPVGSINLTKFLDNQNRIRWSRIEEVVKLAVRFLDNMIDESYYPIEETKVMAEKTRRIGLGIMGFADMLYQMELGYNSEEALEIAEKIMSFITNTAREESSVIAGQKGNFKAWRYSNFARRKKDMRNCAVTSISPTGTISMLADVSSSIEPNFALCYTKKAIDNTQITYINRILENKLKEEGLYNASIIKEISEKGSLKEIENLPLKMRKVFVTTHDISPKWHIRMQAAFQKHVDGAISKTVNLPEYATEIDVEDVFMMAWKLKCKGVTVYRDGCKEDQVLDLIK